MRVLSYMMDVLPSLGYTYSGLRVECDFRWQCALFQFRFGSRYRFGLDVPYRMVPIRMNDFSHGDEDAPRGCIGGPYVWGG